MKKLLILILIIFAVFILSACGDECSSYSDFSCKQIQNAKYNTYFYFPDGREYYLGEVSGLDACQAEASSFTYEKSGTTNYDWDYICCMKAKGSSCYEKHR